MESKYKLRIRSLEGVLLVIAVLLMASCSNNDIVKENVIDQKLCLRGYPQEYLDSFPNTMKEELYDRSYLTFENGCVVSANPYAQISTVDISKDEGEMDYSPYRSNVDLSIKISRDINSGYLEVICSYNWETIPQCRWNDPIVVMWNPKEYTLVDESFTKTDKYDLNDSSSHIESYDAGCAYISPSGICWYAELAESKEVTNLYGESKFNLKPKTNSESSIFYVSYVHSMLPAAISIQDIQYQSFEIINSDMPNTVNTVAYDFIEYP